MPLVRVSNGGSTSRVWYDRRKATSRTYTFTFSAKNLYAMIGSGYYYSDTFSSGGIKITISRGGTQFYSRSFNSSPLAIFRNSSTTGGYPYCAVIYCENINVQEGDVLTFYDRGGDNVAILVCGTDD